MISVRGLRKAFQAKPSLVAAVRDVSFDVEPGEVFVLLGPSGCGKSTTLRCVAGLEQPDGGEISLDGRLVSSPEQRVFVPPERREVSLVFQSYAIWLHMTVLENLTFPLMEGRTRLSRGKALDKAREALLRVRLNGLEDRPATRLSGGQQQRVALARAIATEPKVLLLDEPLSNLDAALREEMREELRGLFGDLGLTILYVTHDQQEALSLAGRVAVMQDGRLVQLGAPEDVYENPASLSIMTFMGATNVIPAELIAPNQARTALGPLRVEGSPAGHEVTLAIRAEDVVLLASEGPDAVNTVPGIVRRRMFLGDAVLLEVDAGPVSLQVKCTRPRSLPAAAEVRLVLPPDRLKVLE